MEFVEAVDDLVSPFRRLRDVWNSLPNTVQDAIYESSVLDDFGMHHAAARRLEAVRPP